MARLRVIEPGLMTTVQDLGRTGLGAVGVPRGGAFDWLSLVTANRIIGNDDGAPGLEFTLTGGVFEFESDTVLCLGAGFASPGEAMLRRADGHAEHLTPWSAARVSSGDRVAVGALHDSARGYLAVAGGIDVPRVLCSGSTLLTGGFGGHRGRALRAGDSLSLCAPTAGRIAAMPGPCEVGKAVLDWTARGPLRAVDGAQSRLFAPDAADAFWSASWRVAAQSDRVGVRLDGPARPGLARASGATGGRMLSEAMMPGAVQVPPDGRPIVLGVDHPTTGGYPVIACVASVDIPRLGRLRPGDELRFERVTLARSVELLRRQRREMDQLLPAAS